MLVDKTEAENRQKHLNYLNGERLYDNQEVCQLLRISKRTLQRYRNNGALKFHSIYIKRQARKDKLSETYPMPEETDETGREKETEDKELSDDCG